MRGGYGKSTWTGARAAQVALLLLPLGGCASFSFSPVDWWHNLEGGPIADARPPPPNADAPYPSLSNVPDKPNFNDAAARGQIADALVADRANAQYAASIAPLTPAAPTPPPPAPSGDSVSNATLAAASAPPPPPASAPAHPRPAPRPPVSSQALPPPAATASAAPSVPPAPPAPPVSLPDMPAQPPAPAALPGVGQATVPTPPPPTPPPAHVPAPVPVAGAPVPVSFPSGSAVLPSATYAALKSLAQQRGGGSIAVVGFGGAGDAATAAQQAAIPLALARARAIAAYLEDSGVPAAAIRIDAEATGQGGVARLIR